MFHLPWQFVLSVVDVPLTRLGVEGVSYFATQTFHNTSKELDVMVCVGYTVVIHVFDGGIKAGQVVLKGVSLVNDDATQVVNRVGLHN